MSACFWPPTYLRRHQYFSIPTSKIFFENPPTLNLLTYFEKKSSLWFWGSLSKSADLSKPWGRSFQILCVSQKVRTLLPNRYCHHINKRHFYYSEHFSQSTQPFEYFDNCCCLGYFHDATIWSLVARTNMNRSEKFITNTTAALKYIPNRPRICINWNPIPFPTKIYFVKVCTYVSLKYL